MKRKGAIIMVAAVATALLVSAGIAMAAGWSDGGSLGSGGAGQKTVATDSRAAEDAGAFRGGSGGAESEAGGMRCSGEREGEREGGGECSEECVRDRDRLRDGSGDGTGAQNQNQNQNQNLCWGQTLGGEGAVSGPGGSCEGDCLRDLDRLRDRSCDGDCLRDRDRLRDGSGDGTGAQNRNREGGQSPADGADANP